METIEFRVIDYSNLPSRAAVPWHFGTLSRLSPVIAYTEYPSYAAIKLRSSRVSICDIREYAMCSSSRCIAYPYPFTDPGNFFPFHNQPTIIIILLSLLFFIQLSSAVSTNKRNWPFDLFWARIACTYKPRPATVRPRVLLMKIESINSSTTNSVPNRVSFRLNFSETSPDA